MGYGYYSHEKRSVRSADLGFVTKSAKDIFKSIKIDKDMNPYDLNIRESKDSVEHPNSIPLIIGLDVTKSMGSVPHYLIKDGLPHIMKNIMNKGINDLQILFMAIGDHKCDKFPLQVGQFESSDDLLDNWLSKIYIEGGGGRNGGESYLLSWYFAYYHTILDSYEKRNKKGYLITIGDEPTFKTITIKEIEKIMGKIKKTYKEKWGDDGQWILDNENENNIKDILSSIDLLKMVKEKYNVYHIHIKQTKNGKIESTIDDWYNLIGENLIVTDKRENVSDIISNLIIN